MWVSKSDILQWTVNYCKLFATTKRTISSIFYIRRHELNIYGPERRGKFGTSRLQPMPPRVKTHENIHDFFSTELNSLTFFWWECFDSFTNSCDFQTTSALQVKHAHTPGARWQDVYFLVVSLLLLLLFLEEIHFLQLLYTARGSQNARNPGIFSFPSLTGWCWWPICLDRNMNPEKAWRSAFHVICPNMFKAETFFQVTTLLPIDAYMYSRRTFKFRSGVAASTASNMGHHLRLWVRDGLCCPRWQNCPPKYILMSWHDSHPNMMDGWTLDFVLSTSFQLMEGVPPSELTDDLC